MRTMLIVDDSESDAELFQEAMSDAGIEVDVVFASDGDEGIKAILTRSPDLVFLDLNMPRVHGFKVLEEVRKLRLGTRIVVCSTSSSDDDVSGSLERGARAYLGKPSRYEDLVEMVRRTFRFWEVAR